MWLRLKIELLEGWFNVGGFVMKNAKAKWWLIRIWTWGLVTLVVLHLMEVRAGYEYVARKSV